MIFYLQNGIEYMSRFYDPYRSMGISSVMLSALSVDGRILLPVEKTEKQREKLKVASAQRTQLLEAARRGDSAAIDSLALASIEKQLQTVRPDIIEVLPALMPKVISRICKMVSVPVIAGGLISDKEDVTGALGAGAVAVSSTNPAVWAM